MEPQAPARHLPLMQPSRQVGFSGMPPHAFMRGGMYPRDGNFATICGRDSVWRLRLGGSVTRPPPDLRAAWSKQPAHQPTNGEAAERLEPRPRAKTAASCGKQRPSVTVPAPELTADRTPHWDVL